MRYKDAYTLVRPDKKKGGSWRYRLGDDPKRRLRSTGKKTKWEAKKFCEKLIVDKNHDGKNMTLMDYAKDFFVPKKCEYLMRRIEEGYDYPAETIQHQRGILVNYILPRFGNTLLSEIKASDFEKWRRNLKKIDGTEMANATKNHIRFVFKLILDQAVREDLIQQNPIERTKQVNKNIYKARDILFENEITQLFPLDNFKLVEIWRRFDYAVLFYLMITTGLRAGEVRALRWSKVDWKLKGLTIDSSAKRKLGIIGLPKNKRTRVVILNDRCLELLERWKEISLASNNDDFIFPGKERGKTIGSETLLDNFKQGLSRAKINQDGSRNLVVHSLRHTYNSIMAKTLPLDVLQRMTGHLSEAMTERYTHHTSAELLNSLAKHREEINLAFRN